MYIYIPASDQANCNAAAASLTGVAADAATFTVSLTSDGTTVVGYWCSAGCEDSFYQSILYTYIPMFPNAVVYRVDPDTGLLTFTTSKTATLGQAYTPDAVLADLGLRRPSRRT